MFVNSIINAQTFDRIHELFFIFRKASLGANASVLKIIDSALFVMCLDDWTHDDSRPEVTVKNLVCGPDPSNRWFDKSFR